MRFSALLAAAMLSAPLAQATDLYPAQTHCVKLEEATALSSLASLVAQLGEGVSHQIGGDIGMSLSIAPIRDAILLSNPSEVCASAVAFQKNIYLYHTYLTVFELNFADGSQRVIPLIFQAASVQAYHGLGKAPWMGFSREAFRNVTKKEFANLEFTPSKETNLRDIFDSTLGASENVDPTTTSLVPVSVDDSGDKYFLATEMVALKNSNPYLTVNMARGLVLKQSTEGKVSVANYSPLFQLFMTFTDLVNLAAPANSLPATQRNALIELSK